MDESKQPTANGEINQPIRHIIKAVLVFGYALLLLTGPLSCWLLFSAQTWAGTGIAVLGLVILALPITGRKWYRGRMRQPDGLVPDTDETNKTDESNEAAVIAKAVNPVDAAETEVCDWRKWQIATLALGALAIAIVAGVLIAAPDGQSSEDSPVSHRYIKDKTFDRYSVANVIPEVEQMNLGFLVMPVLDRTFSFEQSGRVRQMTLNLYQEMEADPHFHRLGSVMGRSYANIAGAPADEGHYYLYVPQSKTTKKTGPKPGVKAGEKTGAKTRPIPAIVFLHGSLGNFKTYTWIWSKLAQRQGLAIIAPSFGAGNWPEPGGTQAVLDALHDAKKIVNIDPDRVYLAGLSNGGLGVCRLARDAPDRFKRLILISPVMDSSIIQGQQFQSAWEGRPALIITGDADRRIPIAYINNHASIMRQAGIKLTEKIYAGEDHFLFFSQEEDIIKRVGQWLKVAGQ